MEETNLNVSTKAEENDSTEDHNDPIISSLNKRKRTDSFYPPNKGSSKMDAISLSSTNSSRSISDLSSDTIQESQQVVMITPAQKSSFENPISLMSSSESDSDSDSVKHLSQDIPQIPIKTNGESTVSQMSVAVALPTIDDDSLPIVLSNNDETEL